MKTKEKQKLVLNQIQSVITNLINSEEFNSTNNFSMIDGYVNSTNIAASEKEKIKDGLYSVYATVREIE